ncbi:S-layer homology domain-containing protein [Planococcus halocryophilus]|uniref:S-layer homology domain-containing protein n=1 Tax=Planococcus halocryophilus TaxID=1215089 RepID=UPI001F0E4803|nr:S-layer homology domain-containing protein [Planococcus halocryophilus]MCH4826820.1 S-layer homology domain-containing protein [Planococcus halocryophilus]
MLKKKITGLLVILTMVLLGAITASAAELEFGKEYGGILLVESPTVYTYTLKKSGTVSFALQSEINDTNVFFLDADGDEIKGLNLRGGKSGVPVKEKAVLDLGPGTYSVKIEASTYDAESGKYKISAEYKDAGATEIEPNSTMESAQKINLPSGLVTGFLNWKDMHDYYVLDLTKGGKVSIEVNSYIDTFMGFSIIEASTGDLVMGHNISSGKPETPVKKLDSEFLEPGKYYLIFAQDYRNTGKYTFKISHEAAGNNEVEGNNGTLTAQPFPTTGTVKGLISWNDREDYYKLRVKKATTVNIKATGSFYSWVSLLSEDGEHITADATAGGQEETPDIITLSHKLEANTDYFIKVTGGGTGANGFGVYTLTIPELQTVAVDFKDVTSFYKPAVDYLLVNKITNGMSATEFGVGKPIIRADAAVWLAKALKLDTAGAKASGFNDVPSRATASVNALKQAGIINGKTTTKFGSNDYLTRGEIAIILQRGYKLSGNGSSNFTDVSSRYKEAVDALVANKVTNGVSQNSFGTSENVTRGQLAVFMYRLK